MFRLDKELSNYLARETPAVQPAFQDLSNLGTPPPSEPPGEPPDDLLKRLALGRRGLERYFGICVAMIVGLFLVQIVIVIIMRQQPMVASSAVGVFGVSAGGLIIYMVGLWRERDRVMTTIVLAEALGREELRKVLEILLKDHFRPTN